MRTYGVKVKPGSKKGPLVEVADDGSLTIFTPERAVEGRANQAIIKILSDHLGISKTRIKIVRGLASRDKVIQVD